MKKIVNTRSFLITETTYDDGSTETHQRGDLSDLEAAVYLKQKMRREERQPNEVRFSPHEVAKKYPTR